jgi:RNA polymerase subunit RPABC4/transcription elongation factor Spt4
MKAENFIRKTSEKVIIKKCHCCGEIIETNQEAQKCPSCKKSFLPSNYFGKVHAKNSQEFQNLFLKSDEIHEDDLIRGINVIW